MKGIENATSKTNDDRHLVGDSADRLRRSTRIHLRNTRRQESAAAQESQSRESVCCEGSNRGGTFRSQEPNLLNEQSAPVPMDAEATPSGGGSTDGQDATAASNTTDQQPAGSGGGSRKRPAEDEKTVDEKRVCYENVAEPRNRNNVQERRAQLKSDEDTIEKKYASLPKPVAIRAVPPPNYMIRPPVQPPHIPMPQIGGGHGAFRVVQPRRVTPQMELQQQLFYNNNDMDFQNYVSPPLEHHHQAMSPYNWGEIDAPIMPNADLYGNNFGRYFPPPQALPPVIPSPIPLPYSDRDREETHSILVQILNSGVGNEHEGNNTMYRDFHGYPDSNGNHYGNGPTM